MRPLPLRRPHMRPLPYGCHRVVAPVQEQLVGEAAKVQRIVEMGFDRVAAQEALQAANGDETAAMEILLGG